MSPMRLIDSLNETAGALVETLDADACGVSRVIGDVLLFVTEYMPAGQTLLCGQGYLVSMFPQTQRVLESRQPRAFCLSDPDVDEAEASVLRELGFSSLLMLPFDLTGEPWGLIEVYRKAPRPFGAVEMRAAAGVLARLG